MKNIENKVLGCYDKKVIAISSFLDILIYKCCTCNQLNKSNKLKKINNCKLISILKNSSMTIKEKKQTQKQKQKEK